MPPGSFSDNKYTLKAGGDTIARVTRSSEVLGDVDTYQVAVAAGVDAAAVIAIALVIDEDHDEERAKERKEGKEPEGGGMWPFG